jgi:putative transcriptional regulator
MFSKYFLLNEIVKFLVKKEFHVLLTSGCFDIAARKNFILLIKALANVDSLIEEQAKNLRAISYFTSSFPLIVSENSNSGKLKDEIIYSRFQLPVVTLRMFKQIIEEEIVPEVKAIKGKYIVRINSNYLRKRRKELNLSLSDLAKEIEISKKALYEIENGKVNPSLETVEKLEKFLKVNLRLPYRMQRVEKIYVKAKDKFQEKISSEFFRLGIDNSPITSACLKIVGKEKFSLIANLSKNASNLEKTAPKLKSLSSIFSSYGIFFVKESDKKIVEGMPIILESELSELESSKELNKLIRERSEETVKFK